MKIILAGGGTGGPVMPLIAVKQKIERLHPDAQFLFVGTNNGLERQFAEKYNLPFVSVPAGKMRRYFSLRNIFAPFEVMLGFFKSVAVIRTFGADAVFAAGGYVAVPVVMAAWILRKKIVIHQQDVYPSLTNQLVAPLANKITVTFESSMRDFRINSGMLPQDGRVHKIVWTGNPVREDLLHDKKDVDSIRKEFGLNNELPVILFLGGATGAIALNQILLEALPRLTQNAQIIHSTGKGKGIDFNHPNYHPYELIPNMEDAYKVADIVICRAGLSTITELSALKKVAIVIPMPNSHQEYNAKILDEKRAAVCLSQTDLTADFLISTIQKIMYDGEWQLELKNNIHGLMPADAAHRIAEIIIDLCK